MPSTHDKQPVGIERISTASLWLGITMALGGLVLLGLRPNMQWTVTLVESIALVFLGTFFVIRFEAIKTFAGRRSTKLGANSVLMVFVFVGILGIINFIASRHTHRLDLSETNRFSLAPQTEKVLRGLTREVKISAFTQSQTPSEKNIKDILDTYSHYTHQISYELIDPDKKPSIAKTYGISQYDTVVLESGIQETQIRDVSEQELTNAIIRVSKDETRKIQFLKDHGEHRLGDTDKDGYSHVRDALQNLGYDVSELSMLTDGEISSDVRVLILAGPQKPLLPEEKMVLATYLDNGGKVLALLDPQVNLNLDDFLLEWGIRLGPGFIVDTISRLFGGDFTIPVVNTYPPHEITEGFEIATFFPIVQRIIYDSADPELQFMPIAQTTPNSWSKSNISGTEIKIDPKEDLQGPFTVAAIVTRKTQTPIDPSIESEPEAVPSKPDPALVVFGDSDFANNAAFYFSGNGDLFLSTVNYLAKETNLIAITPKEHRFSPLFLSRTQGQILMYMSLLVVPGAVFLTGFRVWRLRRRL